MQNRRKYFRLSVFIPFLDNFLTALTDRFEKYSLLPCLFNLLPKYTNDVCSINEIEDGYRFYESDLDNFKNFEGEYLLWKNKWNNIFLAQHPKSVLDTLNVCDEVFFPNIFKLLKFW